MNRKIVFLITACLLFHTSLWGQQIVLPEKTVGRLNNYFLSYRPKDSRQYQQARMVAYKVDDSAKTVTIAANDYFAAQEFTVRTVKDIYGKIRRILPNPYDDYKIRVVTNGMTIEELVPDLVSVNDGVTHAWGDIDYKGEPWVKNVSRPNKITHGLSNRHLSVWASHGRYYDQNKLKWVWQRPNLFGTTEDLFTQTIVIPYLIPMLQNAGAVVFTPRERDWQTNEIIIDNDGSGPGSSYSEYANKGSWTTTGTRGFKSHAGVYHNNENPFEAGTARMMDATKSNSKISLVTYQPNIPEEGKYAVYVSYQSLPKSIPDAEYIVFHKGVETHFKVNQQIGGGTWVYLGTFDFDKGNNQYNRVVLTTKSSHRGIVTADAVRIGGGMGNIERGGTVSGLPRTLEGARYYAQWAGAPYSVYSGKNGADDYADDINVRSDMTNWLAGGSCYVPSLHGKGVPIELSLAVHSDAGYERDGQSIVGSLAICTTRFNDGKLNSGISRMASKNFARTLLEGVTRDIKNKYKIWNKRYLWDRNYSETRKPEVPSAILETLSHQSFPDMVYGQDPNFKFTLGRSIYKTILRFIATQHGRRYVVQPLQPVNFNIRFVERNKVELNWAPQKDEFESTATPTSYNVYMATGTSGFDNGVSTKKSSFTIELEPGVMYNFKVTAVNRGGESFPTEVLSAYYQPEASKTVLIVNGFNRLSAPAIIDNADRQGFDLNKDEGVSYGLTAGWNGQQQFYEKKDMGTEGPGGLGYGGDELAGHFIAGNDFNYVRTHADAIASTKSYNIVSCSKQAVETGTTNLTDYPCVDYLLGLEKYDRHALEYYKTFSVRMQKMFTEYVSRHGNLLVSGSYIGSDMLSSTEKDFLAKTLKASYMVTDTLTSSPIIKGLGLDFDIYRSLNAKHYAAVHPEVLQPLAPAYSSMLYADGQSAGVAYRGNDYRSFVMGFPFECIASQVTRNSIMHGMLDFLLK